MSKAQRPSAEAEAAFEQMTKVVGDVGGDPERPRTRRQLLKLAGAATVGGAGLVIANASAASAATGGNVIMGADNVSDGDLTSLNGAGVGVLSVGTNGFSGSQTAISAVGLGTAPDIKLSGTGKLGFSAATSNDAQPPDLPTLNDLAKSSTGALWSGTGALFDADRRWKRINAVRVDNPTGNGAAFAPFRLVNTIDGTGGVSGKRSVNTNTTYDAAGHANLPDDCIAIFGNLSVVDPTYNNGYIKIFPAGVAVPGTSAINFNAGQTVANFFFLGLGTGANAGKFTVRPGGAGSGSVHVVVDVTAYVQ